VRFPRSSGLLLHPTSLPGPFGIGDLGPSAYRFLDSLAEGGQTLWQVLPLGPTGYGDSPYQSFSVFAGNPMLINPQLLVDDGLLPQSALETYPDLSGDRIDYGETIKRKTAVLEQSYIFFRSRNLGDQQHQYERFCMEHAAWLDDFALFMALKSHHMHDRGGVWNTWPHDIAVRDPAAMDRWSADLEDQVTLHKYQQFLFFKQWLNLKRYANDRRIKIVGDLPIFVAFDSADLWSNQSLFHLRQNGDPAFVAGVPPDYFSATGQRWGNPLYRWDRMAGDGYSWWAARLRAVFTLVDIARIDHFRGFEAYWEIPADEPTAIIGRWVKGPGASFFQAMEQTLGKLPLIAEDLGVITPDVVELRDRFAFPGMKILQFAFGGERNSSFLPHSYSSDCVVYTGTHDNDTTIGWYQSASEAERDHLRRYLGKDVTDPSWDLVRLAFSSVADIAVAPMQDLMRLGTDARMNYPSRPSGNWQWRYREGMFTSEIVRFLAELAHLYGRTP